MSGDRLGSDGPASIVSQVDHRREAEADDQSTAIQFLLRFPLHVGISVDHAAVVERSDGGKFEPPLVWSRGHVAGDRVRLVEKDPKIFPIHGGSLVHQRTNDVPELLRLVADQRVEKMREVCVVANQPDLFADVQK